MISAYSKTNRTTFFRTTFIFMVSGYDSDEQVISFFNNSYVSAVGNVTINYRQANVNAFPDTFQTDF